MISFAFLPRIEDPSWDVDGNVERPAHALTGDDLTFHRFTCDVFINDGCNQIWLRTPGLPVVEFVLMIVQLYREIMEFGESVVESSQTQDSVAAIRRGDTVELTYSFSRAMSAVSLREFKELPASALQSALKVLYSAHEDLRFNRYLSHLAELVVSD